MQLLPIVADRSILLATVARFAGHDLPAPIVQGEEQRFLIAD